jgi:phage baseplate assembly protein W
MNSAIGPKLPLNLDKKDGFIMIDNYVDEVKQNLKTLFLTAPGERVYIPDFGIGMRNYLFENRTTSLDSDIKARIKQQIDTYMPFISIIDVQVWDSPDVENLLYLKFEYFIVPLNLQDQITLSFIE